MRTSYTSSIVISCALLLAAAGCSRKDAPAPQSTSQQASGSWPNILLISVDTLRRDHVGCYGYSRATTPRIDRLATEGALFENMISSCSWTLPAHAAMFTGLADTIHGAVETTKRLPDDRVTLAERLKVAGYTTIGFFSGPTLHWAYGLGQGFDNYIDCTSYPELSGDAPKTSDTIVGPAELASRKDITGPRVYENVQRWLKDKRTQPFFMFVHLWDVHADFIPPPPYDRMFDPVYSGFVDGRDFHTNPAINAAMSKRDLQHIIALYDGEIAWTDMHVGKILDDLDALGLREHTIVMLLSDHGEEFFEHHSKGHRHTLYDELIRVPLLVRYPGKVPSGARYTEQARMVDVVSTLLDLAGLPPPTDVMGHSLAPLFAGKPLAGDTLAVSELFSLGQEFRSYRRPDRKMIFDNLTGAMAVYDLTADPGEQSRLKALDGVLAQAARTDMQEGTRWLTEYRDTLAQRATAPQLPDKTRKQLESLGYIGGDADGGKK